MLSIEIKKPNDTVASEWCEYKGDKGEVLASFLIAGNERPAFKMAQEVMQAKFERAVHGTIPITDDSVLYTDEMISNARYLILDWKGIFVGDQPFEYSPENALKLVSQTKEGVVLWNWINEQSKAIQARANEAINDLVGKSKPSTDTKPADGAVKSRKRSTRP